MCNINEILVVSSSLLLFVIFLVVTTATDWVVLQDYKSIIPNTVFMGLINW